MGLNLSCSSLLSEHTHFQGCHSAVCQQLILMVMACSLCHHIILLTPHLCQNRSVSACLLPALSLCCTLIYLSTSDHFSHFASRQYGQPLKTNVASGHIDSPTCTERKHRIMRRIHKCLQSNMKRL